MTSKWIDEAEKELPNINDPYVDTWTKDKLMNIIERIDKLLRKAMQHIDNEELHDLIRNEIAGKPMMTSDNYGEFEDDKPKEN